MSAHDLASAFVTSSRDTLAEGLQKIEHCVNQLSDEQLWWRPRPEMNSIANLMLHLSGNVHQWIVAGAGNAKDIRNRPREFLDRSHRSKLELLSILNSVVEKADAVLAALTAEQLIQSRRIQGSDTNVTAAVFNCIPHFRGHTQEIIHMTRELLGERYRFDFVPSGPEEESASGIGI